MRFSFSTIIAAVVATAALGAASHAALIDPQLAGNTSYDGWAGLNAGNYPGYGGTFPGGAAWENPIGSNQAGSGDADFDKVSGNGFMAGSSLYVGSFTNIPNKPGGTFAVTDHAALADLATVTFQIEIGEASGYDFPNGLFPTLSYNGGTQALAGISHLVFQQLSGTDPVEGDPLYINTWLVQWDLTSIADAIDSFQIQWSAVEHAQIYDLRLDQSDVYTAIPEPASLALLGMGGLLMMRRRRNARG